MTMGWFANRLLMRAVSSVAGAMLAIGVYVFLSIPADPSAVYFPTSRASTSDIPSGVDLVRVGSATGPRQIPKGPIYKPNPSLTPGQWLTTDLRTICATPKNIRSMFITGAANPNIPAALAVEVFNLYKIPPQRYRLYGLDYLVPLQLGGAVDARNIWPIRKTSDGLGFHEKEVLNIHIHVVVCHGEMPLAQAQKAMAADWVSVWVQYG